MLLYQFLGEWDNVLRIDVELVEEYIANYDLEDSLTVVKESIVGIDEITLQKVLYLPIGELVVGIEVSSDFRLESYFKGRLLSFEKCQGWQTVEALTPKLMEWMHFVQKQLDLNQYIIYISKQLLFDAIGMLEGMIFN